MCDRTEVVNTENYLLFVCKNQDNPKMAEGSQNIFFLMGKIRTYLRVDRMG